MRQLDFNLHELGFNIPFSFWRDTWWLGLFPQQLGFYAPAAYMAHIDVFQKQEQERKITKRLKEIQALTTPETLQCWKLII